MNELADELQRFLDDEPVNARPPSWYEQSRRWRRRNRFASRTFTVTIVLLLAVIVWDYIAFERDRRKLGLNFQQAVQDFKRDSEIHAEVVKCHEAAVANSELARNELEAETKKLNALLMESNATNSKLHEHLGKSITEMTDQVREMRDITAVMIEGAESQIEIGTLAMKAVNDLQDLAANFGDLQEPRVIQALEQLKAQHEGFRTDVQSLKAKIRKHMSGLTSLEETLDEHQELNDQSRQDDQKLKQVLENVNATKDERIPPVP